jgi:hypothetical protein
MKRSVALLTCVLFAGCDTKVPSVAPAPGLEDSPDLFEPEPDGKPGPVPEPVADLSMPPLFATQTGNPPSTECLPAPTFSSEEDCAEWTALLRSHYAEPRRLSYVGGDWTTDAIPFRTAEEPFSLSYCATPEQAPWFLERSAPTEPFCLCASAMDDVTPVALGRFNPKSQLGRHGPECGHVRRLDDELAWTCIYARDEFPGCDPDVQESCEQTCAIFRERAVAHYAATYDVQFRRSRFIPHHLSACVPGLCEFVFELDGQCFAQQISEYYGCEGRLIVGLGQDCSLSDDALLTRAGFTPAADLGDAGAPICNPPTTDGGATGDPPDATANPPGDSGASTTLGDSG